jgi:hypothetical protein
MGTAARGRKKLSRFATGSHTAAAKIRMELMTLTLVASSMHGVELHDIVADSTSSSARGGSRGRAAVPILQQVTGINVIQFISTRRCCCAPSAWAGARASLPSAVVTETDRRCVRGIHLRVHARRGPLRALLAVPGRWRTDSGVA